MSNLRVTNLKGRTAGSSPTLPDGVVVTGVATATTFSGALSGNATSATSATNAQGLTGTPDIVVRNITGVGATFTTVEATTYIGVPAGGLDVLESMLFV